MRENLASGCPRKPDRPSGAGSTTRQNPGSSRTRAPRRERRNTQRTEPERRECYKPNVGLSGRRGAAPHPAGAFGPSTPARGCAPGPPGNSSGNLSTKSGQVHYTDGEKQVAALFGQAALFPNPKPTSLVIRFATQICAPNDVILDFFAGSGTTGHATLDLNRQDGGNRRFILVQLPEPLDPNDKTQKPAIDLCDSIGKPRTIAEITKERVRRVFRMAESNFKLWDAEAPKDAENLARQLELHVDHIRDGRTPDDLLYEILLKSGFPLTAPAEKLTLAGKTVHSVAGGALLICLERELTLELIRAMAEKKPERVVCLDAGFAGNDQLKANAVQIFKTKGVTSFKTV